MRKLVLVSVVSILTLICLSSVLVAADGTRQVSGKVKEVDLQERSIVVGSGEADLLIYLDDATSVLVDGNKGNLSDVKVGTVIVVDCVLTGEDIIATTIRTGS